MGIIIGRGSGLVEGVVGVGWVDRHSWVVVWRGVRVIYIDGASCVALVVWEEGVGGGRWRGLAGTRLAIWSVLSVRGTRCDVGAITRISTSPRVRLTPLRQTSWISVCSSILISLRCLYLIYWLILTIRVWICISHWFSDVSWSSIRRIRGVAIIDGALVELWVAAWVVWLILRDIIWRWRWSRVGVGFIISAWRGGVRCRTDIWSCVCRSDGLGGCIIDCRLVLIQVISIGYPYRIVLNQIYRQYNWDAYEDNCSSHSSFWR